MIPIEPRYQYRKTERAEVNGSRHYVAPGGYRVPSVTTILSQSKDMAHLLEWRKRIGDAAADQITRESTSLGTMMHTHLENYIKREERPSGTNLGRVMARNMADVIIKNGLSKVDEVWGIEVPLLYSNLWAGTTDLAGVWDGVPAIMDFKTTIRPKTLERVEDYFLQLTAYILAHNLCYGTNIKHGVIFMVSRDLQYQQFVLEPKDTERYETQWLERLGKYYDKHGLPPELSQQQN